MMTVSGFLISIKYYDEEGINNGNYWTRSPCLVEFLLSKGYEVHGLIRRSSTFDTVG